MVLRVNDDAYPYIAIQRGEVNDLRDHKERFIHAYNETITRDVQTIVPALPPRCRSLIDLGCGVGGVSLELQRFYGLECQVCLVDGVNDPPFHETRADEKTFCNERATRSFWFDNGGHIHLFLDAAQRKTFKPQPSDLIVSFFSWCFHYPPALYLDWVVSCCGPQTVLILDLRVSTNKNRIVWRQELGQHFEQTHLLWERPKFLRTAWRLKR